MSEIFVNLFLILAVIATALLVIVVLLWKRDKENFRYKLNLISEKLGVAKLQLKENYMKLQELQNLLSQKTLIGHVESEPPKYEGRWQDPDHPIISGEGGKN